MPRCVKLPHIVNCESPLRHLRTLEVAKVDMPVMQAGLSRLKNQRVSGFTHWQLACPVQGGPNPHRPEPTCIRCFRIFVTPCAN
jgi:hypothetical protein